MKQLTLLLIFFLLSCENKPKNNSDSEGEKQNKEIAKKIPEMGAATLNPWFQYYQKENPDFKRGNFKLEQTSPISFQKTSLPILNSKGFNEIYKPFLVFNESKSKYLDFDSYQWFPNADGSASFEADQQVVLVDYVKKEAKQIAYFGPSYWIEEAIWKGDSVAVLMGNSYEKIPFIFEYNFPKNTFNYFKYPDTLQFKTPYSEFRLKSKGINVN